MRRWLVVSAASLAAGCTLLTQFDPEGQPCDREAPAAMQCLSDAGYFCGAGNVCTRSGERLDAGTVISSDAAVVDAAVADAAVVDAGAKDGG